jgi:hypothetical protein
VVLWFCGGFGEKDTDRYLLSTVFGDVILWLPTEQRMKSRCELFYYGLNFSTDRSQLLVRVLVHLLVRVLVRVYVYACTCTCTGM